MKEKINFENYRLLFLHCISLGFWEESNFRKKSDNEEYFETEIILLVRPFKTTTKNIQKAENLERLNILVSSANTNQLVLEYMISSNFITWIAKKLLSKTLLLVLQKKKSVMLVTKFYNYVQNSKIVESLILSEATKQPRFFIATKLPLLIENSLPGGKKITMVQLAIASLMLEEGAKG